MNRKTIDSKLDLYSYALGIHTEQMQEEISADFIIPRLSPQDKKWVRNNTENGLFTLRIIDQIKQKGRMYHFNKKKNVWEIKKVQRNSEEEEELKKISERIYKLFMVRIHLKLGTERNKDGNMVMEALTDRRNKEEEEQEEAVQEGLKRIAEGIKDRINIPET